MEIGVTRREVKYFLNRSSADTLKARLSAFLPIDRAGPPDGYLVRSLYFDTLNDRDFQDKINGIETRQKIRLRIYGAGDATAKLEVKQKQGMDQWKYSVTFTREDAELLIQCRYEVLLEKYKSAFVQQTLRKMQMESYIPRTIVEFNRVAFTQTSNDTRITFDSSIRETESDFDLFSPDLHLRPILCPVILEVKFNRFLLSYIKSALVLADRMPISISKYCLGRQIGYSGGY